MCRLTAQTTDGRSHPQYVGVSWQGGVATGEVGDPFKPVADGVWMYEQFACAGLDRAAGVHGKRRVFRSAPDRRRPTAALPRYPARRWPSRHPAAPARAAVRGPKTGRGARLQPATAFIPAIASVALRWAAVSVGAVGPITTGPSANAPSSSVRDLSVGESNPEMMATNQVPCTSDSAARPCRVATSWTSSLPGPRGRVAAVP